MRTSMVITSLCSAAVAVALAAMAALAVGCSSSSSGGAADAGHGDECEPIDSACGQPCDPGNSLGIGRFCNTIEDCKGTKVPTLCATLGDPSEHFCTNVCNPPDAAADAGGGLQSCGENALCECQGGQCGCYPTTCSH